MGARTFLTQQLQHTPLWEWAHHSNELDFELSWQTSQRTTRFRSFFDTMTVLKEKFL
jgi:hypothetical protein